MTQLTISISWVSITVRITYTTPRLPRHFVANLREENMPQPVYDVTDHTPVDDWMSTVLCRRSTATIGAMRRGRSSNSMNDGNATLRRRCPPATRLRRPSQLFCYFYRSDISTTNKQLYKSWSTKVDQPRRGRTAVGKSPTQLQLLRREEACCVMSVSQLLLLPSNERKDASIADSDHPGPIARHSSMLFHTKYTCNMAYLLLPAIR